MALDLFRLATAWCLIWFVPAFWVWVLSFVRSLRRRRIDAGKLMALGWLLAPGAAPGLLLGLVCFGPVGMTAFGSGCVLLAAVALFVADRLATETAYPCPACDLDRMRLVNAIDSDPHSSGGDAGIFRCRGCEYVGPSVPVHHRFRKPPVDLDLLG